MKRTITNLLLALASVCIGATGLKRKAIHSRPASRLHSMLRATIVPQEHTSSKKR